MTITHRMRDGGPRAEDDTGQPTAGTPPQQQQQQRPPRPPPVPVTAAARGGHPCFWAVLDGESLNFAFVSASLHSFLGGEQAAGVLGESLFDYIHPEEASRARRDLVDTFVSKSLVGSSIR
ncbi:hypothetical protein H4R19_004829 [Coemansia spiralis]|nr:hypothetical protein H4R19_004829 [Coemansia spiralis]